jgi:hypothetical protein
VIFLWVALGWTVLIILILIAWNLALKYGRGGQEWDD